MPRLGRLSFQAFFRGIIQSRTRMVLGGRGTGEQRAMKSKDNPHDICTWREDAGCARCSIRGALKCRHSWGDLLAFILLTMTWFMPAGFGMYAAGFGWWIVVWVCFALFFFNVWETKILCSHCPYYARSGNTLVCIANHGCLKLWEYNPAPMNRSEKAQFLVAVTVLVGAPFPFLVLGEQWTMLILSVVGTGACLLNMQRNVCSKCVNFSCPANRVPKHVVDVYLSKNPVMRDAWRQAGYRIDDE